MHLRPQERGTTFPRMASLGPNLTERAPDILRLAASVLADTPLWRPPGHTFDALGDVLAELIGVALVHPHDLAAHERLVSASIRYGEVRDAAGVGERFIFAEFAALGEALRRFIAGEGVPRPEARAALVRLDLAMSVAQTAAIRGTHRAELEAVGLWDAFVGGLARESPLFGLPDPSTGEIAGEPRAEPRPDTPRPDARGDARDELRDELRDEGSTPPP